MKKSLILFLIITLTACAAPLGVESTSTPEATGTTPPGTATPAPTATEDPLYANLVLQLQTQVEGNSYLTRLRDLTGKDLPVECAEAAVQIAEEQQFDFQVTIDPFGDCRVVSDDGKQAIFPNDEGDLYVTEVGGRAFLEGINHPQADIATIQFDNLSGSWYGEMVNPETGEVLAVATRDANRQWREMKDGQIVDEAGEPMIVPTATADAGSSEPGKTLDVRVADETTLNVLADEILAQKRKFPEGMSQSMNWELIDILNEKVGPVPMYFEAVDGKGEKLTLYYNQEERAFVRLSKSYAEQTPENQKKIKENGIVLYRKLKRDSHTGLTSYFDEATKQWIEIKNSQGVDWSWVGSGEIDEESVGLPAHQGIREFILKSITPDGEYVEKHGKRSIIQFIVTSNHAAELQMNKAGAWRTLGAIEGLAVQADKNNDPLVGFATFVPPEVTLNLAFVDSDKIKEASYPEVFMQNGNTEFQPGTMFLMLVLDDQNTIWQRYFKEGHMKIVNVESSERAFEVATNPDHLPQNVIVLMAGAIWEFKSPAP